MFGIEQKVERAARKGAAFSAAGLLGLIGTAFLTAAGWMILSELRSDLFAATTIGCAYLGGALVAVALGVKKPKPHSMPTHQSVSTADLSPMQLVAVSFVQGFEQGRQGNRTT